MTRTRASCAAFARERKSLRSSALLKSSPGPTQENSQTPSVLHPALQVSSPSKKPQSPLKNVGAETLRRIASPKKLFDEASCTVRVRKPDISRYTAARRSLSVALPDELVGREAQLLAMGDFLEGAIKNPVDGVPAKRSLYISGPPGTGKTTCLKHLLASKYSGTRSPFKSLVINCMGLGQSDKAFLALAQHILPTKDLKRVGSSCSEAKKLLEHFLTSSKKPVLLVLDEIDQLDSKSQEVLYTLFEWPYVKGSALILVGIANALDLTDRVLPRISLRSQFRPVELIFPAYNRDEIEKILASRVKELNDGHEQPIIRPAAIKILAAKISSMSGDVRKALDVCRRAVELAEIEARKQTVLLPLEPGNAAVSHPFKPIELSAILKIVNEVYSSSAVTSSLEQANSDLPLHQKLLVATVLMMSKHSAGKKGGYLTMGKLHMTYEKVCKKRNMGPMNLSEAVSMVQLLDARGIVQLRTASSNGSKPAKDTKVSLKLDEDEVEAALKDKTLLSGILSDTDCIVK